VKEVDRHLFLDKVKSFGIDSCLYEIPKNDWVDDMKLRVVTFPDVYCYLIVTPVDFTGEKLKAYNFVISGLVNSLQVRKRNSAYHSSDVFTVIRAEVRPSQRVNKKPHKVFVAVQTGGTILLIFRWYDSALWRNFSVCVIAKYI